MPPAITCKNRENRNLTGNTGCAKSECRLQLPVKTEKIEILQVIQAARNLNAASDYL
jgi:hypothetical protein